MDKESWRIVQWCGVGIGVLIAIGWQLTANDVAMHQHFDPQYEAVRRQTFEQSKAYNDGMAQTLAREQMNYVTATPSQQDALASVILQQVAGYDTTQLSPDLQSFLSDIRRKRGI